MYGVRCLPLSQSRLPERSNCRPPLRCLGYRLHKSRQGRRVRPGRHARCPPRRRQRHHFRPWHASAARVALLHRGRHHDHVLQLARQPRTPPVIPFTCAISPLTFPWRARQPTRRSSQVSCFPGSGITSTASVRTTVTTRVPTAATAASRFSFAVVTAKTRCTEPWSTPRAMS